MRVLHIGKFYPPHRGGIETHLQTLCRGLSHSVDIEVIVANEDHRAAVERDGAVLVHRLPRLCDVGGASICPTLVSAILRTQADIIHLHTPNPLAGLAILLSRYPAPLVVSWHSDIVRQRILGRLIAPVELALVRRAAALIASSPNYVDSSPTLARNRERVHVIPYGIDHRQFTTATSPANVASIRRKYGDRIVLAVGRLVYYKGFDVLIRAMSAVDGHLLIIGEGPLRKQLEDAAVAAGVALRVSFLGDLPQAELIDHLHAADVFALSSTARSEAFGIVQLEAMAAGKPIVNTRLASGVPFVSRDGETGITVEPGSVNALAEALNRLLNDPGSRARYGAAAKRRVAEEFSADLMIRRTLDLYRQISDRRSSSDLSSQERRSSDTDRPRSLRRVSSR